MDFTSLEIKFYDFIDKLPFDPALYHPHVVHFAIALPILAFIYRWFLNSEGVSSQLFYFGAIFIIFAFITGKAAAPDVKPTLTIAGQDLFDIHKEIGTYLTISFILLTPLRLFSAKLNSDISKNFVLILTVATLMALFYQIRTGTELVYDYGAGTQMQYEYEN